MKVIKMKKYKIYSHKLYSPKDIERRMGIKEEETIDFLEKRRTISAADISKFHLSPKPLGFKMGNFWFIRGREVLEIRKLLKGEKDAHIKG